MISWVELMGDIEWSGASYFSSTNLTRGLAVRRIFRDLPYHEHTINLPKPLPLLGSEPRQYGTAFSVTTQYTKRDGYFDSVVVVVTNVTCLMNSYRGLRNSSRLRARMFTPVDRLSFEHHASGRTIFPVFYPNLEGENPGGGQWHPTSLFLPPTTGDYLRLY
ncbi:hypothetical protein TNCV_1480301 [Trichonephila clavipes]|nr:hypothetical protein TNCV_1480301 [Trichonephila clavipes]